MSTLILNRAQSASVRTAHRSPPNNQASQLKQRPTTSAGIHRSSTLNQPSKPKQRPTTSGSIRRTHVDVYNPEEGVPLEITAALETIPNARPRKSFRKTTGTSFQSPIKQLELHEIHDLLKAAAQEEPYICKVSYLKLYFKLVQTLNLRATPLDWKLIYELQKWENNIIQQNACREMRFSSLMDVLVPQYVTGTNETDSKELKSRKMSIHKSTNDNMEY